MGNIYFVGLFYFLFFLKYLWGFAIRITGPKMILRYSRRARSMSINEAPGRFATFFIARKCTSKKKSRRLFTYKWVFPKIMVPPNHPFVHRVFHYFHHPFWGFYPYFWKHPNHPSQKSIRNIESAPSASMTWGSKIC